jgi:hypothetical protein
MTETEIREYIQRDPVKRAYALDLLRLLDAERAVTAALREFAIERAQALEGWVGSSEDYQAIPDEVAAIEAAARPSTTL